MIVTSKQYYIDKALLGKLDLMCDRCTGDNRMDNVIIIDGDEGYGKSTLSVELAFYCAEKTGREFNVDNIFFDIDRLIDLVKSTKEKVIIWDEAALAGLAADWQKKVQKKLVKLLMICRKKRHIIFLNIPKFFKLNEYIAVDRSIGLIHVYARNERELGHFFYYGKKNKEKLHNDWKKKKIRAYKKHALLRGTFPNALAKIIDEDEYDRKKDEAILNFDKEDEKSDRETRIEKDNKWLRRKMSEVVDWIKKEYGIKITKTDFAEKFLEMNRRVLYDWDKIEISKNPESEICDFAPDLLYKEHGNSDFSEDHTSIRADERGAI